MNNAPELSNVARVLISRMESHPEDFTGPEKRFGYLQDSLMQLIGVMAVNPYGGVGRLAYLSEADKAALADAWRALNYKKFEKEIMDAVFKSDAEFEEERKKYAYPLGQGLNSALGQRVVQQNTMMGQTQLHPAQNAAIASNTLGTALGSGGGFFASVFGGSK